MKFGLILILVLTSTTFSCCLGIPVVAKPGDDVTLKCVSVSGEINQLEWNREDLPQDKYVFFYRDNNVEEGATHQRFKGRVTREDSKTDIVLKNVTVNDTGIYNCRVYVENVSEEGAVNLMVTDGGYREDGGSRDSHVGTVVGVVAGVVLVVAAVGVFLVVRRKRQREIYKEVKVVVEAKPGDTVTLKGVSVSGKISQLEWTRVGFAGDKYVFFYKDNKMNERPIDQSFQDRVIWKDPKTADIVLKNVTVSDTGTYQCQVYEKALLPKEGVINLIVRDDNPRLVKEEVEEVKAEPGEDVPLKGDSV